MDCDHCTGEFHAGSLIWHTSVAHSGSGSHLSMRCRGEDSPEGAKKTETLYERFSSRPDGLQSCQKKVPSRDRTGDLQIHRSLQSAALPLSYGDRIGKLTV